MEPVSLPIVCKWGQIANFYVLPHAGIRVFGRGGKRTSNTTDTSALLVRGPKIASDTHKRAVPRGGECECYFQWRFHMARSAPASTLMMAQANLLRDLNAAFQAAFGGKRPELTPDVQNDLETVCEGALVRNLLAFVA